jgi:hypothetical protein
VPGTAISPKLGVVPIEQCLRTSGALLQLLGLLTPRHYVPPPHSLFLLLRARAPFLRLPTLACNVEAIEATGLAATLSSI